MTSALVDPIVKRPLVWLFSGMASQWNRMGVDLLEVKLFKETIERCYTILATKNLDLMNIITTNDKQIFENVVNSFVGIGAVQIGMINLLREIGVEPEFLIGISFGEVATAYADGCITEKQAILSAYYRGLVILEGSTIKGGMAFIGLSQNELKKVIPEDLDEATHVDPNTCSVSGPKESVEAFVAKIKKQNRYTAILNTSNVAFHSRYIAHLAPNLRKQLESVIPDPQPRSQKWLSSSVLYDNWSKPNAKLCSGEYLANNFQGCVYIEETCKLCPKNSIILEIAPTSLLQTTMKNNFPEGQSVYVRIGDKEKENARDVFLEALKTLSQNGVNVD
ncbi:hypothetical protein ACFFRR_000379 [Megaselia abdita]